MITVAQGVAAFVSGSLSLLSDAVHNLSDVVSLGVSLLAEKLSRKESTQQETFGYKRAEILAALFNAASLLGIATLLCREALLRIQEPVLIDARWVMSFSALALIVNAGSAWMMRQEAEFLNMRSAYLHLLTDALTSLAVLLGGVAMYFFELWWVDSLLSILIGCYLVYSSWGLLISTLRVLMHFTPSHIDIHAIEKEILGFSQIQNVHHIHIWQLTDRGVHFEAHIDFKSDLHLSEVCKVLGSIEQRLKEAFQITHCQLQAELGVADSKKLIAEECSSL